MTISKGCGLASTANSCADGITGTCACATDLCNAAVRPGTTTTASALTLFGLTAADLNEVLAFVAGPLQLAQTPHAYQLRHRGASSDLADGPAT